ncbi:hypothetical protein JCM10213v2_003336 [Rhodosporidiobolus nylandii]
MRAQELTAPPPLPSTTRRRTRSGRAVLVDLSSYALAVPVIPFRLQQLGYDDIGGKTGWLVAAYAGGLIVSSPPAAWIGARWKNRQVPLSVGLLFMAGAIILFMEATNYTMMVVARILQGFSGTVLWTIGLALVTDSVPEHRVGVVLGQVMVGFSLGQAIGPPVGGTMYDRLGYRAPFIFSLCLVAFDLFLRLLIIEKHQALRYIRQGHRVKGFEAPGYVDPDADAQGKEGEEREGEEGQRQREGEGGQRQEQGTVQVPLAERTEGDGAVREEAVKEGLGEQGERRKKSGFAIPEEILGFYLLLHSPRALTNLFLSFMNGFIVGGLLDTGMTIYLESEYGLSSLGAGLVFLGVVVPTFFASPLAGWVTDKHGTKWIMFLGVLLSVPAYPLLIIKGPLALFVFFLVIVGTARLMLEIVGTARAGISVSFFLTPVTVDLAICAAEAPMLQTAHVFGMFNLAFSVGSFVGPIVSGQIVSAVRINKGWIIMASLAAGLSGISAPAVLVWVGGRLRLSRRKEAGEKGGGEGEA